MSKPEDISQEAWDAALSVQDEIPYGDGDWFTTSIEAVARAIIAATTAEREAIIQVCEAEKTAFLSPEYASTQPIGSICERFAIDECIGAIRKREGAGTPHGWKWQMVPDYPVGQVVGACICGSWPGGECLKCPPVSDVNTDHKLKTEA